MDISSKVITWGAAAIFAVFVGLLIFDAANEAYSVPLPLYGTIGLIFGGGAALGFKSKSPADSNKKGDADE